jgi:hypothetical protein
MDTSLGWRTAEGFPEAEGIARNLAAVGLTLTLIEYLKAVRLLTARVAKAVLYLGYP